MKTNNPLLKPFILAASVLVWFGLNLRAQPVITNQPASLTNLAGTIVSFSVGVDGTGPFSYQWQFNGTNFPNNIITTVAGSSNTGYSGDGGAATNAGLSYPSSVAFDASGNLYIADTQNNRIRKMATNGIITTIAGNGIATFAGDGGAATNASLDYPTGVAFDASGNLYIADEDTARIRKVATNGIITTVAGNGIFDYSGEGGAATNASLYPFDVAFDTSGNLYVADFDNNRILKVATNGIITTVAGNGSDGYSGDGGAATNASLYPAGVACDASGNLFIADYDNNVIREVATNGIITTVVGGASLNGPTSVAFDASGNLYIADQHNFRIRKVATNGIITTVAGNGSDGYSGDGGAATNASLFLPNGVACDASGNIYIADSRNSRIRKVDTNGIITTIVGIGTFTGDGGVATNASLNGPTSVDFDASGNLYIADYGGERIRKVNTNDIITTVAGKGNYSYSGDGGVATNASLYGPQGVACDPSGNLYIADTQNNRIRKVDTNGIITTVAGNGNYSYSGDGGVATNASLYEPQGVACDPSGNLYIADTHNNRIRKVATNGIITTVAGNGNYGYSGDGGVATNASLYLPNGVACDASGNLYIADEDTARIRKVATNGIITTVAGNGSYGYSGDGGAATNASLSPAGMACDASGNLYVADYFDDNRILKVDTNGIITTVAGNGNYGYSGDGGVATNASLFGPQGVACDALGNLFIADSGNNHIREIHFAGCPAFTLGNIGTANAGNYTVVVTGPYGSVTSSVATLTVTIPPQIMASGASFGFVSNQFGFNLNGGTVGQAIVVDGSTNLVNWTPLYTNTAGGSPSYFFDPASTNLPARFYRARLSQ